MKARFAALCGTLAALLAVSVTLPASQASAYTGADCPVTPFASHRGDSSSFTESTKSAFDHAYTNGSRMFETDVRFTASDIPVLLHDPTLDVFGSDAPIATSTLTYAESLTSPKGDHIETLWDFVQQLKQYNASALIELKVTPTPNQWSIFQNRIGGMGTRTTVASFDGSVVKTAQSMGYASTAIIDDTGKLTAAQVRSYGNKAELEYHEVTPTYAKAVQAAGVTIYAWTVNQTAQWQALPAGVDPLGDDPGAYHVYYVNNGCKP